MYDLETTLRNAAVDAIAATFDTGASAPLLEIRNSSDTVLIAIGLNATTAVAAASSGVGTFNDPSTGGADWTTFSQNPTVTGTASYAAIKDGNALERGRLTVGVGTGEVQISTLSLDTAVALTTTTDPTLTMPAS